MKAALVKAESEVEEGVLAVMTMKDEAIACLLLRPPRPHQPKVSRDGGARRSPLPLPLPLLPLPHSRRCSLRRSCKGRRRGFRHRRGPRSTGDPRAPDGLSA